MLRERFRNSCLRSSSERVTDAGIPSSSMRMIALARRSISLGGSEFPGAFGGTGAVAFGVSMDPPDEYPAIRARIAWLRSSVRMVPACWDLSSISRIGATVGLLTAALLATHSLDCPKGPSPTMTVGRSMNPRASGS